MLGLREVKRTWRFAVNTCFITGIRDYSSFSPALCLIIGTDESCALLFKPLNTVPNIYYPSKQYKIFMPPSKKAIESINPSIFSFNTGESQIVK